ncbi:hypothetical protein Sxan_08520 [Streptomyces xanthophaeus]|uniref:Uncharacterized protein n=1 Tax=Streptomyces xanthophaeus TaxID=67385 RepID=A0A919GS42_9ACTN|nr:hypothetical protein Sxan_08520 [Streptomyces xanthophaeus]
MPPAPLLPYTHTTRCRQGTACPMPSEEKGNRAMCKHRTAAAVPPSRYDVIPVSH